jgi:two-component system cell cycle sensor histidine kinase/response regulator CckA
MAQNISQEHQYESYAVELSYRRYLVRVCMVLGLPTLGFYSIYDLFTARYFVGLLLLLMFLTIIGLFFLLRRPGYRAKEDLFYQYFLTMLFITFGFYVAYVIGVEGKLSRIPWSYLFPVVVFFALGQKSALIWVSMLFLALLILGLNFPLHQPLLIHDLKLRFYISFIMVILASFFFERLKRQYQEELIANQQSLQESREEYKLLIENANDAIFIVQDGVVKFPNPRTLEMFGYSKKELAKMPFIHLIHPEDKNMVTETNLVSESAKQKSSCSLSFRAKNKNGEDLYVELNTVSIIWEGRPAALNFLRDITEKSRLEARLQRAQKMEAIGTLAGGVAHDLNNILSGIVSYPELLLLNLPEDSSLRKPLQTIQKSGQKAATIVQDLLMLARRAVDAKQVVDLNDAVSEYLSSPEFEKLKSFHPNVQVETKLDTNPLNTFCSLVHLSKVVMNLVSNAAEAMPQGGKISIGTESRYIDTFPRDDDHVKAGDYATLTVSDTGIGISPKDLERVFEPFYTKKAMGRSGTGLGMAVVWSTVEDLSGYIDVQSTEGEGTTFTIYFPVTRKTSNENKPSFSLKDYMGKGESILVVDDVEEQREISASILEKLGYRVASVTSGQEAINYVKINSVALLVLDMILGTGIDGLETYKRILKVRPDQKAIIVSGFSETFRVKKAQRLGAKTYIKKPYTIEKIGQAIRAELDS